MSLFARRCRLRVLPRVPGALLVVPVVVALFASVLATGLALNAGSARAVDRPMPEPVHRHPPNVVLILTDDMRADDLAYMPRTKSLLGGTGTTFTSAVSPNPLCCPARAELLTAEYTHNNGVHSNGGAWGGFHALKEPDNTLGTWLQGAGYQTAYVGKYLNTWSLQRDGVPKGWTHFDATTADIYRYTRYRFADDGRNDLSQADIGRDGQGRGYVTRAMTTIMTRWISEFSRSGEPFFLFDSELAPHMAGIDESGAGPAIPEPKYAGLYPAAKNPATRSAAFHDPEVSDVPAEARLASGASTAYDQRMFLGRIRALRSVDDHVATIVDQLRRAGTLDDTVLVFTSDNGFMLGEHRYTNKLMGYRESLDVPLIISGPGFAHARSAHTVTTVDLASTILDLADAPAGRETDGQSVVGRVRDGRVRAIPIEGEVVQHIYQHEWGWQGVQWGRYTYLRYWHGGQELYDTQRSRWQEENLMRNRRYAGVLARLRSLYGALRACRGETACNPAPSTPPGPRAQYLPRFPVFRTATRTVHAGGTAKVRVTVKVGAPVTGIAVRRGAVVLLAGGRPTSARAAVGTDGRAVLTWDPPRSAAGRTVTLRVKYNGASPDLVAGTSTTSRSVRVVR